MNYLVLNFYYSVKKLLHIYMVKYMEDLIKEFPDQSKYGKEYYPSSNVIGFAKSSFISSINWEAFINFK